MLNSSRIDYRVYICGVEVPAVSVAVSSNVGSVSTCNISLAAHPMLINLGEGDKTQVAVFYLDSWNHSKEPTWCLMFEGYIVNTSYSNSPSSRQVVISCASNMLALSKLYLELLGGKGGGKVGKSDKVTPNEITLRGNYPRRLFTKNLDNKTYITRPSEVLYNIILATTGTNTQIKANPSKSPTIKLDTEITRLAAISKLNRENYLTGLTEDAKTLFLEKEQKRLKYILDTTTEYGAVQVNWSVEQKVDKLDKDYISFILNKNLGKGSTNSNATANTGFFTRFFNLTKFEQHIVSSPIIEGLPVTDPKAKSPSKEPSGVFPMLKTQRGLKYSRILATQTGFKYGENGSALSLLKNLFSVFNYSVTDTVCPPAYKVDSLGMPVAKFEVGGKYNRIAQHITKPVSYFALPPACNAIFPCMIRNWQMSLSIEDTPTRLYYDRKSQGRSLNIKSSKKGYADHGSNVGYPATITRHAQDAQGTKRSDLEVLVFPEEYFKGPNPVFREIDPLFFEIKKQENAGRIKKFDEVKPDLITEQDKSIAADQLNLVGQALIKSADKGNPEYALYVKKAQLDYTEARSAARTATVNTVFNPYVVADFPCMLFDTLDSGCHVVGYVTGISHTLSQQQAVTQISLGAVRTLKDTVIGAFNQGMEYPIHPMEPVTEVREVLQRLEPANFYYANLLYRDSLDIQADANYTKLFYAKREAEQALLEFKQNRDAASTEEEKAKYTDAKLTQLEEASNSASQASSLSNSTSSNSVLNYLKLIGIQPLESTGPNKETGIIGLEEALGTNNRLTAELAKKVYTLLLRGVLVPKDERVQGFFEDLTLAMEYIKRPVCTLEQYIDFYQNSPSMLPGVDGLTAELVGGRGRGTRGGKKFLDNIDNYAPYYSLIREFVGGPGFEPGSKVATFTVGAASSVDSNQVPPQNFELKFRTGSSDATTIIEKVFTQLTPGGMAELSQLPDVAVDWQDLLLRYRNILNLRGSVL